MQKEGKIGCANVAAEIVHYLFMRSFAGGENAKKMHKICILNN